MARRARRRRRRTSPAKLENELSASVLHVEKLFASWDDGKAIQGLGEAVRAMARASRLARWLSSARPTPASGRRGYEALGVKKRGGVSRSPHEAGSMKDWAAGMEQRRRSTPVGAIRMLRRRVGSARKEKLWALGRAACATRRKRELREASTGDKKLRRESRQWCGGGNSLVATHVGARRECGGLIGGEGQLQEPSGRLYRARRGRGGDGQEQWPSMAWRAGGLDCIQGEGL
jgi:hypothetical protein